MTLREKLIVLRDKAGISQMSLAHQLDVSRQAASRWESGDTTPSMDKLKALAKIYGVSLDWLCSDSDMADEKPIEVVSPLEENETKNTTVSAKDKRKRKIRFVAIALVVGVITLTCIWIATRSENMGKAEDGALLLISGEYLLRPDFDAGKLTAILHWADNANTSVNNYRSVLETESGFFAWNSDVEAACFYEKLPEGETLEDPTVITLFAGTGSYDIEIAAANFQKLYPQYRIDITAAESDEQTELALTELGAGKGYDMYLLYDTQWAQLDDAVFFEDLTRWMEADSTKPLERIRPSVLRQVQKNGGVYRLPVDYTILTYAADPEQLPDCRPETVLRACEQGDDTLYPFARNSDYSSQMAKRCAIDYVDAAQETCNFECDSFYAQLALLRRQQEALDALPKNLDVAATCDGLLYYYVILSADSIVYQPGRYVYPELKQYVYYAYPSDYDSGCQLDFNSLLSINTKSEQKAGAWAFLSYLLSESYQQSMNYLPVSDTVLQEQFAQLLAQEKITQENIDTFYALVDHAQKPDYPTEPIEQIILEEMAAYLDGAIDEKTTAERIQSRVSLYLMEQKVE